MAMMMHSCLHSISTTGFSQSSTIRAMRADASPCAAIWPCPAATPRQVASVVRCGAINKEEKMNVSRREAMAATVLAGMAIAAAPGLPTGPSLAKLCDADCDEKELENIPPTTTASGLQFKDIVVGSGDSPPVGFQNQVAANYVAMIPNGKVFDSSLEKGVPYIFRVGAEQVIKGLDEGILSMKAGGKRRLYIPGEVAFPNGLGTGAGRLIPPPSSLVVFDVCLIDIPDISYLDV